MASNSPCYGAPKFSVAVLWYNSNMKMSVQTLLCAVALLLPSCVTPIGNASETAQRLARSEGSKAVKILQASETDPTRHYCASAFPIDRIKTKDGRYSVLFLTCKHAIDKSTKTIIVWRFDGDPQNYFATVDLTLVTKHPKWDSAWFVVRGLPAKFAKTCSLSKTLPHKGQWVLSAGYALCRNLQMYTGTIDSAGYLPKFGPCMRSNAEVFGGMSGGPVIDRRGKVVGYTVAKGGPHQHYFIPVAVLASWLPSAR